MKKGFFVSGTVLAITFLIMVALFLVVDFDYPSLGNDVLQRAQAVTGMDLKAAGFRLSLARGLIWEDVEGSVRFPGGRFRVRIDRMVLEHRVLPLLVGRIVIRRVRLERPRIEVSTNRSPRLEPRSSEVSKEMDSGGVGEAAARPESSPFDLALLVSEIQVNEATMTFTGSRPGRADLFIQELDVGLRNLSVSRGALTLLHALTATGEVRARRIAVENTRARDLNGVLELNDGRVELRDLVFTTDSGTFASRLAVDFNRIPLGYAMDLDGGPLNVSSLADLAASDGLGPGYLELDVEGFGGSTEHIRGKGVLRLEPGRLPAYAVLVGADEALEKKVLVGSRYEETEIQFRVQNDQFIVDHFHLETKGAALDLSGVVHRDGPLDLSLVFRRPGEATFHVTGSLDEPHLRRQSPVTGHQPEHGSPGR